MQLQCILSESFLNACKACFASDDKEAITAGFVESLAKSTEVLGSNTYMCGDRLSLADFIFFEFVNYGDKVSDGSIFDTYPTLKTHQSMMKELPGVKEFIAADHETQKTYLPPSAKC